MRSFDRVSKAHPRRQRQRLTANALGVVLLTTLLLGCTINIDADGTGSSTSTSTSAPTTVESTSSVATTSTSIKTKDRVLAGPVADPLPGEIIGYDEAARWYKQNTWHSFEDWEQQDWCNWTRLIPTEQFIAQGIDDYGLSYEAMESWYLFVLLECNVANWETLGPDQIADELTALEARLPE